MFSHLHNLRTCCIAPAEVPVPSLPPTFKALENCWDCSIDVIYCSPLNLDELGVSGPVAFMSLEYPPIYLLSCCGTEQVQKQAASCFV